MSDVETRKEGKGKRERLGKEWDGELYVGVKREKQREIKEERERRRRRRKK